MHELGESSIASHADIGTLASQLGIDHLVCIAANEYSSNLTSHSPTVVHVFENKEEAVTLVNEMSPGDVILVKASRAEKFEELAQGIEESIKTLFSEDAENVENGGVEEK
jgi:UDP-N-acetylmuramoyl-tripeptide--D-alanyl-D-alanine ligase